MTTKKMLTLGALWGLFLVVSGCVIMPDEGFYDRGHHRYYSGHRWHDCGRDDRHCGR